MSDPQGKQIEWYKTHCMFVQEKCYQYWPDQGCWTYGNIRVSVEDCIVLVDYTIRKFCVQSVSNSDALAGSSF